MKILTPLLIFISLLTSCGEEKETIYLLFEANTEGTCHISAYRDGREKKEVQFTYQKNEKSNNDIRFNICYQTFEYQAQKQTSTKLTTKPNKIVNIDYLLNKWEEQPTTFDRSTAFENIYIVESNADGTYTQYQVNWIEVTENKY